MFQLRAQSRTRPSIRERSPLPAGWTAPVLSVSSIANTNSSTAAPSLTAAAAPAAPAAPASSPSVRITLSDPKATDVADIKSVLDKPAEQPAPPAPDLTALKRTLVLTIAKGVYRPADRLVSVKITIRPTNFIISDVTNFTTDYSSVDIAKLNLTQSNSVSASISPTFAGSLAGTGQFGYTGGNTLEETATLSVRPEIQNVNMDGSSLVIYREADRGSDLAGNTLVSFTVHPLPPQTAVRYDEVVSEVNLVSKTDGTDLPPQPAPNDKEKVAIKTNLVGHLWSIEALKTDDFVAEVLFDYVKRRVVHGQDTYAEYKQVVEFETGRCYRYSTVIIPAREIDKAFYVIRTDQPPREVVYISEESGPHEMYFTDFVTADRMAKWMMRQKATQIGPRRLTLGEKGSLLTPGANGDLKYAQLIAKLRNQIPPLPSSNSIPCVDRPVISVAD